MHVFVFELLVRTDGRTDGQDA